METSATVCVPAKMAEVRQSLSSNAEELHHRLSPSDPLDTAGSVSACQIGSVERIGHCPSGLGTAEPQVDRDRLISFVKAVHLKYQSSDDEAEAMDNIVIIHMSGNIKTTCMAVNIGAIVCSSVFCRPSDLARQLQII